MSKIHALRLVNVSYNHDTIRISDETFAFHGANTLLSLRNGGGKSVLVQMMTAPFVHKRYRDTRDRPFESYFTTHKPSVIMVEWALDGGAGFVLTGMVIRKNQEVSEDESGTGLEILNFITEYKEPCGQDIHRIPVIEKTEKSMRAKSFASIRQLFEGYKKDHAFEFYFYDMNSAQQSRQYFDKLAQYQVYYKEWETIIKKVNVKESGLSDLFADCKDEKGLVEKWFLDAVESKLNKDKDRIQEFRGIIMKFIRQYKDNQSKIQKKDGILLFLEKAEEIRAEAEHLAEKTKFREALENKIAAWIWTLTSLAEKEQEEIKELSEQIRLLEEKIQRVQYEEISYLIHGLNKDISYQASNRDMIDLEREELLEEKTELEKKLHIQECAKLWEEVLSAREEYALCEKRCFAGKKKEEELAPERTRLGSRLYRYYREQYEMDLQRKQELAEKKQEIFQQEQEHRNYLSCFQKELEEKNCVTGKLTAKIEAFQEAEDEFNNRYQENLIRNILGEYEPGALAVCEENYQRELLEIKREQKNVKTKRVSLETEVRGLYRELEDRKKESADCRASRQEAAWKQEILEQERAERSVILKYLSMPEEELFEREKIEKELERKLTEISRTKRELEKEYDGQEREYKKLTRGKILELPKEFEEMLKAADIHYVYGMKWLEKNGRSPKENQRLVRENPFLPYALLLTEKELDRLKNLKEPVYAAAPVPILLREELEEGPGEQEITVASYQGVNFYLYFNESLLDEEMLKKHLEQLENSLDKMAAAIAEKEEEYHSFFAKREKIRNQKLERKLYEDTIRLLGSLEQKQEKLKEALDHIREQTHKKEEEEKKLAEQILIFEQGEKERERKISDFMRLKSQYEEYRKERAELIKAKNRLRELEEMRERSTAQLGKCRESAEAVGRETEGISLRLDREEAQANRYQSYQEEPEGLSGGKLTQEEAVTLEAEFRALGETIFREQKELEEAFQKAEKQYRKWTAELKETAVRYNVPEEQYQKTIFQKKEKMALEQGIEDRQRKAERLHAQWNEANTQTRLLEQKAQAALESMKAQCQKEEPVPKSEITALDFPGRKKQYSEKKKNVERDTAKSEEKLRDYEENLVGLSEYAEFEVSHPIEWQENFKAMSRQELKNFKGILVRDYTGGREEEKSANDRLLLQIHETARKDEFRDEYFAAPLETLLKIMGQAGELKMARHTGEQVLEQLRTHCSAFRSLLEKLMVDISIVGEERDKIIEILGDYIREVHENIGKIDRNSTISIRDKSVKMLKIQLQEWEENQGLYETRLQDLMEEITVQAMALLEKNENVEEFLGTRITTKYLYDRVAGMSNAKIQLYKIEEQREYPITWSEVARNSGGEGFLSAFVILSSLLYYMRKDDSDLFADKRESKVLVMDNPFAQTNAAHLLNPLMDIAKKTNTQLICLSGLGGDSIYNCFDNIYVLNLAPSRMRAGMRYLKAEQAVKGEAEEETLLLSQIEVLDQQELLF